MAEETTNPSSDTTTDSATVGETKADAKARARELKREAREARKKDKESEKEKAEAGAAGAEKGARRGVPTALAVAAAVLGLVAGGVAIYLHTNPGVDYTNEAFVDTEKTTAAATAAAANAQKLVEVDYEHLDDYRAALPDIVTPNLVDELDKSWPQLSDTYKQSKTKVTAQVSNVGVSYLEGDRAEVLVAQDVSVTQDGQDAGETVGTYLLQMQNVDGTWKLSSIPDLPS